MSPAAAWAALVHAVLAAERAGLTPDALPPTGIEPLPRVPSALVEPGFAIASGLALGWIVLRAAGYSLRGLGYRKGLRR